MRDERMMMREAELSMKRREAEVAEREEQLAIREKQLGASAGPEKSDPKKPSRMERLTKAPFFGGTRSPTKPDK
jgi:hypothetical protein